MTETKPFVFLGCLDLNELLPHEAHDARELLEQLEKVPVESVFCHTSAALLHRPVLAEAYPTTSRSGSAPRCATCGSPSGWPRSTPSTRDPWSGCAKI